MKLGWTYRLAEDEDYIKNEGKETELGQPLEFLVEMAQEEKIVEFIKRCIDDRIDALMTPADRAGEGDDAMGVLRWSFSEHDGCDMRLYLSSIKRNNPISLEDWYRVDFSEWPAEVLEKDIKECARYALRKYRGGIREWERELSEEYSMIWVMTDTR